MQGSRLQHLQGPGWKGFPLLRRKQKILTRQTSGPLTWKTQVFRVVPTPETFVFLKNLPPRQFPKILRVHHGFQPATTEFKTKTHTMKSSSSNTLISWDFFFRASIFPPQKKTFIKAGDFLGIKLGIGETWPLAQAQQQLLGHPGQRLGDARLGRVPTSKKGNEEKTGAFPAIRSEEPNKSSWKILLPNFFRPFFGGAH